MGIPKLELGNEALGWRGAAAIHTEKLGRARRVLEVEHEQGEGT
jgi:hypothetical protein